MGAPILPFPGTNPPPQPANQVEQTAYEVPEEVTEEAQAEENEEV